ncbi:MAG: hypothetical protein JRJ79_08320, partial [Deltaproteobacteria bacterium]|nr:hypothetical protein [Deltaproteobacteria bacterium]
IPKLADAISLALEEASASDAVCITGSLYTVGDARAYLDSNRMRNAECGMRNADFFTFSL